ncbi:hypothetical protein ACX818_001426 [Acinetobacter baumannii]
MAEIKDKLKTNFKKNPKATASLMAIGVGAIVAALGTVFGVVEPEVAMAAISKLISALTLGI